MCVPKQIRDDEDDYATRRGQAAYFVFVPLRIVHTQKEAFIAIPVQRCKSQSCSLHIQRTPGIVVTAWFVYRTQVCSPYCHEDIYTHSWALRPWQICIPATYIGIVTLRRPQHHIYPYIYGVTMLLQYLWRYRLSIFSGRSDGWRSAEPVLQLNVIVI